MKRLIGDVYEVEKKAVDIRNSVEVIMKKEYFIALNNMRCSDIEKLFILLPSIEHAILNLMNNIFYKFPYKSEFTISYSDTSISDNDVSYTYTIDFSLSSYFKIYKFQVLATIHPYSGRIFSDLIRKD